MKDIVKNGSRMEFILDDEVILYYDYKINEWEFGDRYKQLKSKEGAQVIIDMFLESDCWFGKINRMLVEYGHNGYGSYAWHRNPRVIEILYNSFSGIKKFNATTAEVINKTIADIKYSDCSDEDGISETRDNAKIAVRFYNLLCDTRIYEDIHKDIDNSYMKAFMLIADECNRELSDSDMLMIHQIASTGRVNAEDLIKHNKNKLDNLGLCYNFITTIFANAKYHAILDLMCPYSDYKILKKHNLYDDFIMLPTCTYDMISNALLVQRGRELDEIEASQDILSPETIEKISDAIKPTLPNGYKLDKILNSKKDFVKTGNSMKNCLGNLYDKFESGNIVFFIISENNNKNRTAVGISLSNEKAGIYDVRRSCNNVVEFDKKTFEEKIEQLNCSELRELMPIRPEDNETANVCINIGGIEFPC